MVKRGVSKELSDDDHRKSLPLTYETRFSAKCDEPPDRLFKYVIGVDEAGRGPLAGPVVVAAVAVPLNIQIEGVNDSKTVDGDERNRVFEQLTTTPGIVYSIVQRDNNVIDDINILAATLDGMASSAISVFNACEESAWSPTNAAGPSLHATEMDQPHPKDSLLKCKVLVDGNKVPPKLTSFLDVFDCQAVVKGDAKVFSIAAASILAKVTRDGLMIQHGEKYPMYGFAQHKGYPTASHVAACSKYGVCEIHRMAFNPIKTWLISGKIALPEGMTRKFLEGQKEDDSSPSTCASGVQPAPKKKANPKAVKLIRRTGAIKPEAAEKTTQRAGGKRKRKSEDLSERKRGRL